MTTQLFIYFFTIVTITIVKYLFQPLPIPQIIEQIFDYYSMSIHDLIN